MARRRSKQTTLEIDAKLADLLARCGNDPLGFVLAAFPWGEGELSDHQGPDVWQITVLTQIRDALMPPNEAIRHAIASGHGIGKSALVSWIVLWALATRVDTRGIVTANTEAQLRTKTWPELAKWHRLSLCHHWFCYTTQALYSADPKHEQTWRMDATPWSKSNPAAFAGLHNQGNRVLLVFDEASEIDDSIWEVAEGAMTDANTDIIWLAFGNPTRNTGRFRECFGRFRHRWTSQQVDSRQARLTNKTTLNQWISDYGEDSDFVRVRIKGQFPRAGSMQLISLEMVEAASQRTIATTEFDPLILGVDVARFGDDQSVICARRGRNAAIIPIERYRGLDTMQLAARVANLIMTHQPDAVFVDETGVGGGVVDRLRQLGHSIFGVNFGARADGAVDGEMVANKRAEMWCKLKSWLGSGGCLPADQELANDLIGVEYGYNIHNEILLEKKDDMKRRGLGSPDAGDALALTFAYPVAGPAQTSGRGIEWDFDPFSS